MALASSQDNQTNGLVRVAPGTRTGTRTAANFTITLGFAPKYAKVINLEQFLYSIFLYMKF